MKEHQKLMEEILSDVPTDGEILIAEEQFGFDRLTQCEQKRFLVLKEMDAIGTKHISDVLAYERALTRTSQMRWDR